MKFEPLPEEPCEPAKSRTISSLLEAGLVAGGLKFGYSLLGSVEENS